MNAKTDAIMPYIVIGLACFIAGILLGSGTIWYATGITLGERDRELAEYRELRGRIEQGQRGIDEQVTSLGSRIAVVTNGISDLRETAERAVQQGGSVVESLKKLTRNLQEIQVRVGNLEVYSDKLERDYSDLRDSVATQMIVVNGK